VPCSERNSSQKKHQIIINHWTAGEERSCGRGTISGGAVLGNLQKQQKKTGKKKQRKNKNP